MSLQHTRNLLTFWNDKFSLEDFETLVSCVDKISGNQKIGNNKFLLVRSANQRDLTQLIMLIRNIIGLVHCQFLSCDIDNSNYRTKLFTSNDLRADIYGQLKYICSSEYTQSTHTNASVICACLTDTHIEKSIEMRAIVIDMI
jgi:hypothetical protein